MDQVDPPRASSDNLSRRYQVEISMYDDAFLKETLRRALEDMEYFHMPKGVKRYDYGSQHGWWVRIRRDKVPFRHLSKDSDHGSSQESLKQALIHRHNILKSFPVTIKQIHSRSLPIEPENRIKRHEEEGKLRPYIYWRARWYNKDHKIESEIFSITKYGGEEEAKSLALEATRTRHNQKPKLTKHPDLYQELKFTPISRADVEVLASINDTRKRSVQAKNKEILNNDPFAFEGEKKLELHKSIERDRKLRNQKISTFLDEHGKLFCELCDFNFLETYPFLSKDIIEVHHIIPLGTLSKGAIIKISDLMLLCSNCHFAVHQGEAEETLLLAMDYFESLKPDS